MNCKANKLLNRTLTTIACLAILIASVSCQRKHEGSGGSVVGNGFIHYRHSIFDFAFNYPADLKLTNISERQIQLDNQDIATKLGLKQSELKFSIISTGSDDSATILKLAAKLDSTAAWKAIETSGVQGVYYRNRSKDTLEARYVFRLNDLEALDVQANATTSANGIDLITSVIDSITFDSQAPVIHEVIFEPAIIKAGETAKLKIRATDNMTAIVGKSSRGSVAAGLEKACRELITANWDSIETCGEFRAIGNDWYEYDIPTHPKMKPGLYILHPLTVWDSAGNVVELNPDHGKEVYEPSNISNAKRIPLRYLQVENQSPDVIAPQLQNVHFEPSTIEAGENTKLVFEAVDDNPNYAPLNFCEKALHKDWFRFVRTDIPQNADVDPTDYSVSACSQPVKRPDGNWEINLPSEHGLPPGEYIIDFSVKDDVGNRSAQRDATLLIQSSQKVDVQGPQVLEVKSDRPTYRRGETGSILIRASDDISGVVENLHRKAIHSCRSGLVIGSARADNYNERRRIPLCDSAFRHIENDWYAIDFTLSDKVPVGRYFLPSFTIEDRVGNKTFIEASGSNDGHPKYTNKFSQEEIDVDVLSVEVVE